MQDLKVSLIQTIQFWEDKTKNLRHFENHLANISEDTDLIILPEMFHTSFSMHSEKLAETMDGEGIAWLKKQAKNHKAAIVASLIITEDKKYFNRMVFVEPTGKIHTYDKIKLFGLAKENNHYSPGTQKTIVEYKGWKIILQVCYDLRFPELVRNKVNAEGESDYDISIYVANWPKMRNVHWKSLLQARAIENQSFVLAVNRVGSDDNGLDYSGDSSVINALGEILAQHSDEEVIIEKVLSRKDLKTTREKLPFLRDR